MRLSPPILPPGSSGPFSQASLRSQIATSNTGRGGRRALPWAFIEHGVAMLSSVLTSKRAVQVNIEVVRAFGILKKAAASVDLERLIERRQDVALREQFVVGADAADDLAAAARFRDVQAQQADVIEHAFAEGIVGVKAALVIGDRKPRPVALKRPLRRADEVRDPSLRVLPP